MESTGEVWGRTRELPQYPTVSGLRKPEAVYLACAVGFSDPQEGKKRFFADFRGGCLRTGCSRPRVVNRVSAINGSFGMSGHAARLPHSKAYRLDDS